MHMSKWVRVDSCDEPVARVAARMLRSRVTAVAHFLPLAGHHAHNDAEYVHQLRVWSRRAEAAVELCRKLLPKRSRKKLASGLKQVRRAAGAARDADVLLERLAELPIGAGQRHLLAEAQRSRAAAQGPLRQASESLQDGQQLLVLLKKVTDQLRRKQEKPRYRRPIARWARRQLSPQAEAFFRQGRSDLTDPATLHRFRIAGKRLRYTWELLAAPFGKRRRKKLYAQLDFIQAQLGHINDLVNFIAQLQAERRHALKRPVRAQLRRVLAEHHRQLNRAVAQWREYWSAERARRFERRFRRLRRPAV
jgi:CHAD domain-containing protein